MGEGEGERKRDEERGILAYQICTSSYSTSQYLHDRGCTGETEREREREREGGGGAWEMSHTISITGIPGME